VHARARPAGGAQQDGLHPWALSPCPAQAFSHEHPFVDASFGRSFTRYSPSSAKKVLEMGTTRWCRPCPRRRTPSARPPGCRQSQSEHFAASQPASTMAKTMARSRWVRSAPTSASTSPATGSSAVCGGPEPTAPSGHDRRAGGGESFRHRVRLDRRVAPGHQLRVEARHRRQPTGDGAGRQSRLAIGHPHHGASLADRPGTRRRRPETTASGSLSMTAKNDFSRRRPPAGCSVESVRPRTRDRSRPADHPARSGSPGWR